MAEWTSDWFDADTYNAPTALKDPQGASAGTEKMVCGGSYASTANVTSCNPRDAAKGYADVGFRCAYSTQRAP